MNQNYWISQVRDGSKEATLLFKGCFLSGNVVLQSAGRWLWVKFHSNDDAIVNTGFTASWLTKYIGNYEIKLHYHIIALMNIF